MKRTGSLVAPALPRPRTGKGVAKLGILKRIVSYALLAALLLVALAACFHGGDGGGGYSVALVAGSGALTPLRRGGREAARSAKRIGDRTVGTRRAPDVVH